MKNRIERQNIHGNRNYKSSFFCMVFDRKKDLLELYNAVNGTNYQNADDLEVNTLDNVLYMTMKNDVSFVIGCTMNLYEHQSSYNPNMPLRGLLYFARLFSKYAEQRKLNLYSSTLQKIPAPRYIVFYNGMKEETDRQVLKLSDAFQTEQGCLECEAIMLNINYGRNLALMEKCRRLEEYAIFVDKVRKYAIYENMELGEAITSAIDECIDKGILTDILTIQRAEVFTVILETFDKELYERDLRAEIRAEVREEVQKEVREEVKKEIREEVKEEVKKEVEEEVKKEVRVELQKESTQEVMKELIRRKLVKGKSVEEIADALEENPETIVNLMKELEK